MKTKIQWCDYTWNPWRGCAKVSPGCVNCYADGWGKRFGVEWGPGKPRQRASAAYLRQPLRWDKPAERDGVRPRVFCGSLMDWLDPEVPIEWLAALLDTIRQTPNLDWLLLTKRPELWRERMRVASRTGDREDDMSGSGPVTEFGHCVAADWANGAPPPNVWLGVSAEDQDRRDERALVLLNIPAAVRFVSVEPMLGPIDMRFNSPPAAGGQTMPGPLGIHWIILGGESGPKARPCNVEWIRGAVRQCRDARVPTFVKQLGARPVRYRQDIAMPYPAEDMLPLRAKKGDDPAEWPEDLRVREWPKEVGE